MLVFKKAVKQIKKIAESLLLRNYKPTMGITYHNGWMSIEGNVYKPNVALSESLKIYSPTDMDTDINLHSSWMHLVASHSKDSLVKTAIYLKQEPQDRADNIKRCVTVSAHAHGITIPESLCLMDKKTALLVLIYAHHRRLVTIDIEKQPMSEYVQVSKLAQFVSSVLKSNTLMPLLFSQEVPPNIHNFMNSVQLVGIEGDRKIQSYQKVLTCIYLKAGLPIPHDYLYFDIEVHDYVKRSGNYEDYKYKVSSPLVG